MRCSRCKKYTGVTVGDTYYECDCGHKWPIFPYNEQGAMRDKNEGRVRKLSFRGCSLVTPDAKGHF
jgi:hypothetical protein